MQIDGTPLDQFICTQQSWEAYLSTMEAPGTWGDHLVLLGAAEFLQADIEVITTASETHPITIKAVKRQHKTKKLFLGHISEFHYVSLNELGQVCRDCHLELSVCQCVDNINANDTKSSPPGYGSEEDTAPESSNIHLPETRQVSKAFFEKEEDNLATYLRNLIQGHFSGDRDGRGERHTMFLQRDPYQDVKAGFASSYIPAELYGHLQKWLETNFTHRIPKDKSATTHYIFYVAVKEACLYLTEKSYMDLNRECSQMESVQYSMV